MTLKSLKKRVNHVQVATVTETIGRIVIIYPDSWPESERLAYRAAQDARNWVLQADIVERVTGERPVFPVPGWRPGNSPAIIEIITRSDGPQEDVDWTNG